MPARRWTRTHTVVAAVTAVALAGGGVGAAVALQPDPVAPAAAPPVASTPTSSPTQAARPAAAAKPAAPSYDPLTGGKRSSNGVLAVKVENIAAARPQAGLSSADIVFVEEVEARLTRLVAVYHSRFPGRVGPVRSARNTDVQLLPLFGKPGLVYSGANSKVERNIQRASITPLQRTTRDPRRVVPHNVFVDLDRLADATKLKQPPPTIGWTFAAKDGRWSAAKTDRKPSGRVGGDRFTFDYRGGRYLVRWNGQPYAGDVRVENVVVLRTRTTPDGNADVNGVRSVKSETVGSGKVTIYRDGRALSGTWKRASTGKPMQLLDSAGKTLPLRPGKTWVLLSR